MQYGRSTNSDIPSSAQTNNPYGHARWRMPTRNVVLNGSTSASFSASPIENTETVSRPKKRAYFSHFSRSCQARGNWRCQRLKPIRPPILWIASDSEPNGHSQPQNSPRPKRNTVRMMKIQKQKMNGSVRNSDHVHWNSSEWNHVSTCVIDGWAIAPKPTKPMLRAQALYLKALTGHLFLWVARRVRRSRSAYTTPTATSRATNRAICGARVRQTRRHGASGASTCGRPPCSNASGSQYGASNVTKLRVPVARSTRLPRSDSFHGYAAENPGERTTKMADSV